MFYPCVVFSFINEPSGFLNIFIHLKVFWQLASQFNCELCRKRSSPLMICCCLMIWVPFSAMRNVHLQLPFVFSFSPFFFFSQSLFYYFLSPCTKNNLLIILVILYTLHDSLPFLFEVGGAKRHSVQSDVTLWISTLT